MRFILRAWRERSDGVRAGSARFDQNWENGEGCALARRLVCDWSTPMQEIDPRTRALFSYLRLMRAPARANVECETGVAHARNRQVEILWPGAQECKEICTTCETPESHTVKNAQMFGYYSALIDLSTAEVREAKRSARDVEGRAGGPEQTATHKRRASEGGCTVVGTGEGDKEGAHHLCAKQREESQQPSTTPTHEQQMSEKRRGKRPVREEAVAGTSATHELLVGEGQDTRAQRRRTSPEAGSSEGVDACSAQERGATVSDDTARREDTAGEQAEEHGVEQHEDATANSGGGTKRRRVGRDHELRLHEQAVRGFVAKVRGVERDEIVMVNGVQQVSKKRAKRTCRRDREGIG